MRRVMSMIKTPAVFISTTRDSIFPARLLLTYVTLVTLIPTFQLWLDFDSIERSIEDWNWELAWSLILLLPILGVVYFAVRYFRQMPFFAGAIIFVALWNAAATVCGYFHDGFDHRFDIELQPLAFLRGALVFAAPFVVIYFIWRCWPQRVTPA